MIDGTGERLVLLLGSLSPSQPLWEFWIGQLRNGPYEYGFGVLRDGADRYDPMGILAEINDVDWVYDEAEGAYAVAGEVDFLPTDQIRSYLGIPRHVSDEKITQFANILAELTDSETSHVNVANALYYAQQRGSARRSQLEGALSQFQRERYPMIGDFESDRMLISPLYRGLRR